jgi:hypothetical protein
MRKGLVVTLGVVALLSAVSSGFSFAPVISCIPDVIISDAEQNQTSDLNFFIFSDALNLDSLVRDDDTTKNLLKWSFFESTAPGNAIKINGIGSVPDLLPATLKDPGANNLRAVTPLASFQNVLWSPPGSPTGTSMTSTLQMIVSDGTAISSQSIMVKTVNTGVGAATDPSAQKDALIPQAGKSWAFATTSEGWSWFSQGGISAPTHATAVGKLTMTEPSTTTIPHAIVYGAWESPQNPTAAGALKARYGCVVRARFAMSSSVNGQGCPGLRFRAWWTKVLLSGSTWIPDWNATDFVDLYEQNYTTLTGMYVQGREPGTAGKTFTMLYYPQQTDTLMSETSAVVYVTCDLLDDDAFGTDAGIINIDQVDVDGFARPPVGAPGMNAVPGLSFDTNFSSWASTRFAKKLDPSATTATLTMSANTAGITITCGAGTSLWEYGFSSPMPGVTLADGRYYRALWQATSSQTPGGPAVPTVRTGIISTSFSYYQNKKLEGGASFATLKSTPTDFEQWWAAPSNIGSTTATEPFQLRFEAYVLFQPDLRGKQQSGTVGLRKVTTEWMNALP